jgi:hypothetical protein
LAIDPERVLKTLIVTVGDRLTACILPAGATLDLRALGTHAAPALTQRAERVTGYVAGGISPLGRRRGCPRWSMRPPELRPQPAVAVTSVQPAPGSGLAGARQAIRTAGWARARTVKP